MCRDAVAVLLALIAGPLAARGQMPRGRGPDSRGLLARAESLEAQLAVRDSQNARAVYRQRLGHVFRAGDVTVVLTGTADEAVGTRVATRALARLDTLGAIPPAFLASRIVVATAAEGVDSVLRVEGLAGRTYVRAVVGTKPDTATAGLVVADALARAYHETLDSTWRTWAPADLALGWIEAREGEDARRDIMGGETRAGAQCLAGDVPSCALWLGLDRDAHPYRTRYAPADIRRLIHQRYWLDEPFARGARECVEGSDEACIRFAEGGRFLDAVPAFATARASVLRAVRSLHGPDALRRALADSVGSLGARLTRAAGVSEDSLLKEWRSWLLTGGGGRRVTGDFADAVPVAVFGALLLLAAARSGRWR